MVQRFASKDVSAVMLAGRGQHGLLASALSATVFQSVHPAELVIMDFASRPALSIPQIAEGIALISQRLPVTYVNVPDPDHHGWARILAFRRAKHDWIWWLEDDVFVSERTLEDLLDHTGSKDPLISNYPTLIVPRQMASDGHLQMLEDSGEEEMLANYRVGSDMTKEPLLHGALMSRERCEQTTSHWANASRCSDVVTGYLGPAVVANKATAMHFGLESDKSKYFVPMLKSLVLKHGLKEE